MAEQQGDRLNLNKPRYDQSTYIGRCKHFFNSTDPRTILASTAKLHEAKALVDAYKNNQEPEGTTRDEVWAAKKLVDSAFHPETGELMFLPGRMSFQVPGNMIIGGCMLTFYRTAPAVVFWQVMNQSFNAVVNFTNRSGSKDEGAKDTSAAASAKAKEADWEEKKQLGMAFGAAVTASTAVGLGLNKLVQASPRLRNTMIARFVPLVAVAAANCVNIPLMRQQELRHGVTLSTEDGKPVAKSTNAAKRAVAEVTMSRIFMAAPGMIGIPLIMHRLEHTALLQRLPLAAPVTILLNGVVLCLATPMCCALFPQQRAIGIDALEDKAKEQVQKTFTSAETPRELYYNKGL